jgi:hypothetical protein
MPADQRGRSDDDQSPVPVKAAGKPDQGETSGVSGALRLDMALLVKSELFAQKEIFCRQGGPWAQTQPQEARGIPQKCHLCAHQRHEVMEQAWSIQHMQGTLLKRKNHC